MEPSAVDWFGASVRPLAGGNSGETFVVGEGSDQVVLRIYRRRPERALVDAALMRLVRGLVPVPDVLEVRPPSPTQPAVVVTGLVPGVSLERVMAADVDAAAVGRRLADLLGALSGIPFLRAGFFDGPELGVGAAGLPSDLAHWARHHRDTGRLAGWPDDDWLALERLVDVAEDLLESAAADVHLRRTVLVHGDVNPKNIIVDPESAEVAALVDWEFAHAGSVLTDLGNLTRFERHPDLLEALSSGLADRLPSVADDPLLLARASDLWSLIELAGDGPANPVRTMAADLLLAQARSTDLTAWPWQGTRVDPAAQDAVS